MKDAEFWQPHLRDGERLIWTGRPRGGWSSSGARPYARETIVRLMISLVMTFGLATFALFALGGDLSAAGGEAASLITLLVLFIAAIVWRLARDRAFRRRVRYAITDQRVLTGIDDDAGSLSWVERATAGKAVAARDHVRVGQDGIGDEFALRRPTVIRAWMSRRGPQDGLALVDLEDGFAVLRILRQGPPATPPGP